MNLVLAAVTVLAAWKLQDQYRADQKRAAEVTNYEPPTQIAEDLIIPEAKAVAPFTASSYPNVTRNNLFSRDRNPNVITDPVPPVEVKPPRRMPPLPVVLGVTDLPSGVIVIISDHTGADPQALRRGELIGEYTIRSITPDNVTVSWDTHTFTLPLPKFD